MRRVITTLISGDKRYYDMLKVFVLSLMSNDTFSNWCVVVYAVNGIAEEDIKIRKLYPYIILRPIEIKQPTPIKILYSRIKFISDLLDEGHEYVASIDVDVIFRKNLDVFWSEAKKDGISIWDKGLVIPLKPYMFKDQKEISKYLKKKAMKINTRLQGGVFVLGNGQETKEYWGRVVKAIPENPDGYCIQRVMFEELKGFKLVPLSPCYNDSNFNAGSVIWHGKSGHRNNQRWVSAFNEYLDVANKLINGKAA